MVIRKATLADAYGVAKVHVESWKTTYKNIVPDEYLSKLTYENRKKQWERNIVDNDVFVAEDDNGQIIGFADGGKERTGNYIALKGELYSIYILEGNQNRGLGKLLTKAVIEELLMQDIKTMLVWVLKDNGSCGFYEKLGGKIVDSKTLEISGKQLTELAYGWEDISLIK